VVVVVRFKQPLLHNRLFNLSLTEEDMYRLKIYGMRITAAASAPRVSFGAVAQLGSLVDVCSNLLEVSSRTPFLLTPSSVLSSPALPPSLQTAPCSLTHCGPLASLTHTNPWQVACMAPPVRNSLHADAEHWLPLWLRALRTPHVLGGAAGGYLPTYHLRLKVVQLLPFVLSGALSEPALFTAYGALLDVVTLCSPEALMLPTCASDSTHPDPASPGHTHDDR
jgi:hypothetical protein